MVSIDLIALCQGPLKISFLDRVVLGNILLFDITEVKIVVAQLE